MTSAVLQTRLLTARSLRTLSRQPAYLVFTLVQPMVWLLLFGALFERIAVLPGFGASSYLDFLTPGVVVMTAMSTAGWSGTSIVEDLDRGVMDRTLASPVRQAALTAASLLHQGVVTVVQSLILLGAGLLAGARYSAGAAGVLAMLGCAVLLACAFAALSDAVAVLVGRQDALIAISQFLTLPLTFLSSVMIAPALLPGWVAQAARANPVNWAAEAAREALRPAPDWIFVLDRSALLLALTVVMAWLADRAYHRLRRTR